MTDDWGHDDVQRQADESVSGCWLTRWWRNVASPWLLEHL